MSLSWHIVRCNARRVAGRKRPARQPVRLSVLRRHCDFGYSEQRSAVTNIGNPRREMRHHPPALEKQPITESSTMSSSASNDTTILVAFKAIRCSRRAQLWNRQASIVIDLTTLALRRGWHSLPRI
jgi:hypothetical protein